MRQRACVFGLKALYRGKEVRAPVLPSNSRPARPTRPQGRGGTEFSPYRPQGGARLSSRLTTKKGLGCVDLAHADGKTRVEPTLGDLHQPATQLSQITLLEPDRAARHLNPQLVHRTTAGVSKLESPLRDNRDTRNPHQQLRR